VEYLLAISGLDREASLKKTRSLNLKLHLEGSPARAGLSFLCDY